MKTIFITGASSGLGLATAKLFINQGWKVLGTLRNAEEKIELTTLSNVTTYVLDVTLPDQINSVVSRVISEHDVDVVFNNAGYGLVGAFEALTDQQLVGLIATNLLAPMRITNAFLPSFRERRSGLFINTTSLSALIPEPFMQVYAASKAGLEQWATGMSFELRLFGIGIKTIVPGFMRTNFASSAQIASSAPYEEILNKVMQIFAKYGESSAASTPEEVAKVVFEAANDGSDQIRYLAGKDAKHRESLLREHGLGAMLKATNEFISNN